MLSLLLTLTAHAATPDLVLARIEETKALRTQRLDPQAPLLGADVYAKAAAGKVQTGMVAVEGHKAKKIWGVAVIDVPIGKYWAAVNDDRKKMEWTKLEYAEVLQGEWCGAPRRVFQFIPVPLVTDRWWVIDVDANAPLAEATSGRMREQAWKTNGTFETPTETTKAWAAKGMHIASTRGSWLLTDIDGKSTLVEYYTWADPGGSIPAGLASSLASNSVDDTLTKMGELAEAGTTCKVW